MPDKIVNHFVLADGSVARYDYDGLVNVPFGDDLTEVSYKTRAGYIQSNGSGAGASSETQEVYTNKLPCFPNDTVIYSFKWQSTSAKWGAVGFYDKDGRFLSRSNALFSASATEYSGSFTIPSEVYYYRITWRTYGNCIAKFSYNGSVYDIRNRIDRGLLVEDLNNEYDYCTSATGYYNSGQTVLVDGWRPITGLFKIPNSRAVSFKKSQEYSGVITVGLMYFDADYAFLNTTTMPVLNNTYTYIAPDGAVYARAVFDGQNAPNTSAGSPTCDIIRKYITIYLEEPDVYLTPIICGSAINGRINSNRPTWDTANGTFTIPYDCIYFKNGREVRPSYLMGVPTGTVTVLTIPTSSTALQLFFDISENDYVWHLWDDNIVNYEHLILVAVFRTYANNPALSINAPYIIDGKPYGIDANATVDYDAVAWAFNENVKGINHRGYNTAPENTLPAYKLSKQVGFKYVECDVSMTSDRVPVLLHDDTINRTARNADGTEISQTISIGSITYEQALQYDFGIYKGSQYAGTKIPTFEQFITLCRNLGLHPYIELKSGVGYTEAEVQNLVDIVRQNGMDGKVTWISFNANQLLTYVKNYDAFARIGYVVGALTSENITTASNLKTATNEVFLDVSSISDDLVDDCITAGLPVEVWTINTTAGITALNDYISGVTSDNLIASKVLYEENI